jgi:predicted dienelactone hydrolase
MKRILTFAGKVVASLILLALAGVAVLFFLIRHEHNSALTLPEPTGNFAVGRSTFRWSDPSARDELSPVGAKREVMVWIWYPAARSASAEPAPYIPVAWRSAFTPRGLMGFLTRDLSLVHTHSTLDPPVARDEPSYPVVLMRAGGAAPTTDFTTLAADLASHGYVIAGFDAPYRTYAYVLSNGAVAVRPPGNDPESMASDAASRLINKLLPMWVADTEFVVDQLQRLNADDPSGRFTGRLDLQRLGMFGHSFGGAQTLQFCHDDPRCKAGIDIDGAPYGSVVREGVKQPFMILLSDHRREAADPDSRRIAADLQSIYARLPNGRAFVTIRGANHFSFSDQILLKSQYVIALLRMLGFGNVAPRRGLAITADYVHTFFDVYLKHAEPASALQQLSRKYPEVRAGAP